MRYDERKFYKNKGFYIACFLALFAVLSVVGVQGSMKNEKPDPAQEYAQLEETTAPVTVTDAPHNYETVNADSDTTELAEAETEEETTETMAQTKTEEVNTPKTDAAISASPQTDLDNPEETEGNEEAKDAASANETSSVAVLNTEDQNQGLTWPVSGDVLLPYSMDKPVYFTTLGQYKCNPALLIAGTAGDQVVSACDCEITKVKRTKETGLTITAKSGSYTFIYGQLANPKVSAGDTIKEGQVLATLAGPTDYYANEGCNLYFQIKEDDASVDPLLLLK